ncbi:MULTISPECIES: META domain-containing protein [unclassified Ectothiorhodospira]|uniref:META domain-containing protein n=1 Tax=unclassified Ectothiorhodospira TaxID=2684909 RepID=UPI001EE88DA4|nr:MULTISPECIES: META domain-containing protein [unclassified Ectothiorhodospira]MCG5516054.1 META domain-containing protein [Ectothiorhodospira sp. 9100]MCG5519038.1 META domain-containing protein [Ectothiorhodospira sp. 9905]
MNKWCLVGVAAASVWALVGCGEEDHVQLEQDGLDPARLGDALWDCGGIPVITRFRGESLELVMDNHIHQLQAERAASGARYAGSVNGSPVSFWNRGDEAVLTLDDETRLDCHVTRPPTYRAQGNEPGWRVDIGPERLELSMDYGQRTLTLPTPDVTMEGPSALYAASTDEGPLDIRIEPGLCRDTMTGMSYPDQVSLTWGEARVKGCGGDPHDLLVGEEWRVVSMDDEPLLDDSRATVDFLAGERVAGVAFCNRYTGPYRLTGEAMEVGPLASTRMACPEPVMEQERFFLRHLESVSQHRFDEDGALVLETEEGLSLRAVRGDE